MKKKILIIKNKDDISKKNIIFYDEYLYYLYPKNKKMKKKNFFFSLKNLSKTKYNTIKLHNKIDTYRKELSPKLNFIHKKKLKEKDWGLILDNFLFQIINPIIIETNNFKKILKKEKNIQKILSVKRKELSIIRNIEIEYLELRNKFTLKKTKKFKDSKIFIAYYINDIRLIDNF